MTVFELIVEQFPEFDTFTQIYPAWYRSEVNYGMALRALEFAQELKRTNRHDELKRLFEHIEDGMSREDVETALCLDFVQRISDVAREGEADFLPLLGPLSRQCYDLQ
jgi:predicted glycoside hydrolase/deacetylase ChbG (UPF0249 family)